jgi:hypothetical protein
MPLNFNFLGNCHNLALALHGLTGLPLCLLYGERELENPPEAPEGTPKPTQTVLIHAGVIWSGCFYDENGNQGDPGALMRAFKNHNPDYSFSKIFETEAPNLDFYAVLQKTGAVVNEELVAKFTQWLLDQKGTGKYPFLD